MYILYLLIFIIFILFLQKEIDKKNKFKKLEEERLRKLSEEEKIKKEKEKQILIKQARIDAEKLQREIYSNYQDKYLGFKLYNYIKNKYESQFNSLLEYKKYLINEFPVLFNFFENTEYRDVYNEKYIHDCKKKYKNYFIELDDKGYGLTDKQLDAVFCDEDATLVNAGAGTGKTKTIESKILHLVKNKGVSLDKILVMTFSKKSQLDMKNRIMSSLKKANIQYNEDKLKYTISTFHAFGKGILDQYGNINNFGDQEKLIGKGGKNLNVLEDTQRLQILRTVFENIKKDSLIQEFISKFILYYSSPQVSVSKFESLSDYYQFTKKTYKTLLKNGEYNISVKSYGEVLIANFLWQNNVKVEYEPKDHFYTDESTGYKKTYKPDFYLPDYNLYIEYFGVDKNGNTAPYIGNKDYIRRMNQKIQAHKISNNKLIDIRYADLQKGQEKFLKKLGTDLKNLGVILTEKEAKDIIELQEIIDGPLKGIGKILNTFLNLYKESDITIEKIKEKIEGDFDFINLIRNKIFLTIFEAFLKEYTKIMNKEGYMDFGDMIYRALDFVKQDNFDRKYDYILIDEFQDISKARASLIKGLLSKKDDSKLFCVGDDRQSIYQFAGSDSNIFLHFSDFFGYTKEITLDKTFRFNQGISELSSGFITMNTAQKVKKLISNDADIKEKILVFQKENENYDYFFNILNDVLNKTPDNPLIKVLLLTRYSRGKYDDGFFEFISEYKEKDENKNNNDENNDKGDKYIFPHDDGIIEVTHLTSHKSKGLEADYVIVDYVNQGERYDFPSNFEDDPILQIITNDKNDGYSFAEERRLFYVSMTRGKHKSYIVYKKGKESTFIKDLLKINRNYQNQILKIVSDSKEGISILENDSKPDCPQCGGKLEKKKGFEGKIFLGCINYPRCDYNAEIGGNNSPKCPFCQSRMVKRKNKVTGEEFWGCTLYPNCKGTKRL